MIEWKQLQDFPLYEISTNGDIRNIRTQRILKGQINVKTGYVQVCLFYYDEFGNRKRKGVNVHRLVVKTFLNTFNEELDVNHIDGNKQNNNISNLELLSRSDNLKHSFRLGLRDNQLQEQKINYGKHILQYDLNDNFIQEFSSITEAAKFVNTNMQNISAVINGRQKTSAGYKWRMKEVV